MPHFARYSRGVSEGNVETIRRLFAHWERGDYVGTTDFFHADVEFEMVGGGGRGIGAAGKWRGVTEMWSGVAEYFRAYTNMHNELERIIDLGGDQVLALSRQIAEGKSSGIPVHHEVAELFTLRDGKIVQFRAYYDRSEAFEAAGLSE
jgi:ketosteroid isomerase-like protein